MKAEIICIIDRSGSMASIASDAIGGFNRFLEDQKAVPGEAKMTIVLFDNEYLTLANAATLETVKPLTTETFVPRGGTAMLDAIGRTLTEHGKRIAEEKWAEKVIVCILTDGQENCSREYNAARIKEMIQHAEKVGGWAFVYLAANQDAFATGAQYGISEALTQNFAANAQGTAAAYAYTSAVTRNIRTGATTP